MNSAKHSSTVYPMHPQIAPEMSSPLNALYQHRVDAHADHNEKCLEAQGQQGAEIILPRIAPFPVYHRGEGDRPYGGHKVNFNQRALPYSMPLRYFFAFLPLE